MKHINQPVGNFVENNAEDVLIVKKALNDTGYRDAPFDNGIIERETDEVIRKFQQEKDLKIDGILYPNGETEKELRKEVAQADAVKKVKKTRKRGNVLIDTMKDGEKRTNDRMEEDRKRFQDLMNKEAPEAVDELVRQRSDHLENTLKDGGISAIEASPPILKVFLKHIFDTDQKDKSKK